VKLTKSQLVKIIKEELIQEGREISDAFSGVMQLYQKAFDMGMSPDQLAQLEKGMQSYWNNLIDAWRTEREEMQTKTEPVREPDLGTME